jgi:hypothetical protein
MRPAGNTDNKVQKLITVFALGTRTAQTHATSLRLQSALYPASLRFASGLCKLTNSILCPDSKRFENFYVSYWQTSGSHLFQTDNPNKDSQKWQFHI